MNNTESTNGLKMQIKDCVHCGGAVEPYESCDVIDYLRKENEKLHMLTDLQEANVNTLFENNMELRKEIERLTEERNIAGYKNNTLIFDNSNLRAKNAELQKQVDELKGKICELVADKCNLVVREKQIIKDTTKEILQESQFDGNYEVVHGVEVYTPFNDNKEKQQIYLDLLPHHQLIFSKFGYGIIETLYNLGYHKNKENVKK